MIDIQKIEEKNWVGYPNDEEANEKYLISYVTDEEIRSTAASFKGEHKIEEIADLADYQINLLSKHVHEWKDINLEGKPWPCNAKNRKEFFSNFLSTRGHFLLMKMRSEELFFGVTLKDDLKN